VWFRRASGFDRVPSGVALNRTDAAGEEESMSQQKEPEYPDGINVSTSGDDKPEVIVVTPGNAQAADLDKQQK
jgi:hypothetical protein